jgi:hypothetical protein
MSPLFSFPRDSMGADCPDATVSPQSNPAGKLSPQNTVGQAAQGEALKNAELEQHIRSCELRWRAAYHRFQQTGLDADRQEAVLWLHQQNQAILSRSEAEQARRHAEFERHLDERFAFFNSDAAADIARLPIGRESVA